MSVLTPRLSGVGGLKFTECDAKLVIGRSMEQLKDQLAQADLNNNAGEIVMCKSGKGIITMEAVHDKIRAMLEGNGEFFHVC